MPPGITKTEKMNDNLNKKCAGPGIRDPEKRSFRIQGVKTIGEF
jgi:hypothetical protein